MEKIGSSLEKAFDRSGTSKWTSTNVGNILNMSAYDNGEMKWLMFGNLHVLLACIYIRSES